MASKLLVAYLAAVCLMAVATVSSRPAAAQGYCDYIRGYALRPGTGYAGDVVNISMFVSNDVGASVDVNPINVTFSWDPSHVSFYAISLPPYGYGTTSADPVFLPPAPGDYTANVTMTALWAGTSGAIVCGPYSSVFTVYALPPPPSVIALVNRTSGVAPLSVTFQAIVSGGLTPVSVNWTFGDGTTASGPSVQHTFQSAGTYAAQVVVTDSRGRSAANESVTVAVSAPSSPPTLSDAAIFALLVAADVAVLGVAVFFLSRRYRLRERPPPG